MSAEVLTSDVSTSQEQVDVVKQEFGPQESSTPLSTPPTSPLLPASLRLAMASGDDATKMPPPSTTRKRSRDGTKTEPESSQIVTSEDAQLAGQGKELNTDTNFSSTMMPPSQTQGRSQQFKDNTAAVSTASQKAPPSNQGAAQPRKAKSKSKSTKSSKASKAAAKKQIQEDSSDEEDEDDNDEGDDDDSQHGSENSSLSDEGLPEKALPPFDWAGLEQRHRNKMVELETREQQVLEEFNHMIGFFGIWADVGSGQEVDRSSKRLKTQRTYVQHEENELENKRQHYMKVVEAFTSALALLQN